MAAGHGRLSRCAGGGCDARVCMPSCRRCATDSRRSIPRNIRAATSSPATASIYPAATGWPPASIHCCRRATRCCRARCWSPRCRAPRMPSPEWTRGSPTDRRWWPAIALLPAPAFAMRAPADSSCGQDRMAASSRPTRIRAHRPSTRKRDPSRPTMRRACHWRRPILSTSPAACSPPPMRWAAVRRSISRRRTSWFVPREAPRPSTP